MAAKVKQVFISYSSKEASQVNEIVETLERKGIECWIAPRDIRVGSNYTKDIPSAIQECPCFLLVLSRQSQKSQWVNKELTHAINQNKRIFPLIIEEFTLDEGISFQLVNIQTCSYYQEKATVMGKLMDDIRGLDSKRALSPETVPAPEELTAEEYYEKGNIALQEENYTDAITWYQKAAKQEYANAQYCLGLCYANGWGVVLNHETAVEWYRKAAGQGHADAQYCLGLCYANGWGVTLNHETAVEWYRKAAGQSHADAQYCLGLCYANGWGVEQNDKTAVEWYHKSAELGNAEAQTHLRHCHETGRGVSQDYNVASEACSQR